MLTNMTTHEHQAAQKIRTYRQEADDYRATHTSISPAPPRAHPRGTWLQLLRTRARSIVPLTNP